MRPSQYLAGLGVKLSQEQELAVNATMLVRLANPVEITIENTPGVQAALPLVTGKDLAQPSDKELRVLAMARSGQSGTKIAAATGFSTSKVSSTCARFGVKMKRTHSGPITIETAAKVLAMVESGANDVAIGIELGISDTSVRNIRVGEHPITKPLVTR